MSQHLLIPFVNMSPIGFKYKLLTDEKAQFSSTPSRQYNTCISYEVSSKQYFKPLCEPQYLKLFLIFFKYLSFAVTALGIVF